MGAVLSAECERARKRASLALDGELSEIGQASLRAHVGCCAVCAEFQSDLAALTTELRAAPLERPRGRYAPRRRSAVRLLQVAAVAAAVAFAAALGGLAGSLSSSDPSPSGSQGARGVIVAFHDGRMVPRNLGRPVAL